MYDSDQVNDYSKKELAEKIFNGEVSREQVNEDGLFRPHRPMLDEELGLMKQEELDWTNATAQNTVESYQTFLDKYNPTIVEGESITDGWVDNTVYIGRHVEDARRLQAVVKKNDDVAKETDNDKAAWVKAKNADTIDSYIEYISVFDRQPPLYRGQYVDEAKLMINKLQDELDWEKAKSLDTIDSYKSYLDKYGSSTSSYQGAYISDAKKAIERLAPKPEPDPDPLKNETENWVKAVRADNLEAYKDYLAKYEIIGGKYVAQAKNAIERLLEEKAWSDALNIDKIAGYKKYISLYEDKKGKHLIEAKLRLNQLEDDLAWMAATKADNLSAYRDYLSKYDVLAPKYRGRHIEDAKNRIAHIDDKEWEKATKTNTLTAYHLYVSKFDGNHAAQKGKHLEDAKIRINRIMDDDCWANAVKQNTKEAYQDYLQKYPHGSHVSEAQKRIKPPVPPTPWFKYVMVIFIVAACVFLGWQYWNKDWPFSHEKKEKQDAYDQIAVVDSLQWAIDNQNIPLLTKFAEMDSTRAYYPLALALNAEDSVANVEKTLHWLDFVLDPDVNSLHQNIINDIQEKELDEIESRFAAINPNEKDADRKYLEVYIDYVSHFERLATHTPRIRVQYLPIEDMANAQIKDRQSHEELRTSILREWETQQSRLKTILSQIEANAKKAYSSNH